MTATAETRVSPPRGYRDARPIPLLILIGAVGVALVGKLDFLTGYQINLSFFYLAPIVYCAWMGGWKAGAPVALTSAIVAMLADILIDKATAHEFFSYWNALNRSVFFGLVVFMVDRIRTLYIRQTELVQELNAALAEVRKLSGLLPMCSWCKKIRGGEGYWQQVEDYLSAHSEAEFTHGICPECDTGMRKMIGSEENDPAG